MKRITNICLLALISFGLQAQTVINFDDILNPGFGVFLPDPYNEWSWDPLVGYVADGPGFYPGSGYDNGAVSPPNVAYNGFAVYPWTISFVGPDECIDLTSLTLTAAWNTGLVINIDGLKGGIVTQTTGDITLDYTGPTTFDPGFRDIDEIVINLVASGTSAGLGGSGEHIALDDFTYVAPCSLEVVPTLGEWAIICLGLVLAIFGTVSVVQRQPQLA